MLSNQLRNIANKARGVADQQQTAGQSQIGMQTQQAVAAQPQGIKPTKASAQELAASVTGAQQQVGLQAQQLQDQAMLGAAQQGVQARQFGQQQALREQESLNATEIAKMQRQGALKQNSEQLRQAKQLQKNELEMQKRLQSASIQYDNRLSFLTRKQREDLANFDEFAKQQIFDNRLSFRYSEGQRKFADMRQLADYAMSQAKDQQELQKYMREMNQAAAKEIMVLKHAHDMIQERLKMEFKRSEGQKDNALKIELYKMEQALKKKIARKQAKSAAMGNLIQGVVMAAGVAMTIFPPTSAFGPMVIASAPAVAGAATSQGATM